MNTPTLTCEVCKREITPEQQKGGYYIDDPKAWHFSIGFYHAGPKHKECGWRGVMRTAQEHGDLVPR